MPSLESLEQEYKNKKFKILLINARETIDRVDSFIKSNSYSFTVLLDSKGTVSEKYAVLAHPTAFLIDKQGQAVFRTIGYHDWNTEKMHELFDEVIKEKGGLKSDK